jgi:hypothetical protein
MHPDQIALCGGNMAAPDVTQKTEIYESLSGLIMSFSGVVEYVKALQRHGILTPKYNRLFSGFAHELQAEITAEILTRLHDLEMRDWTRYGKVRQQWEKYLKGKRVK